MQFDFGTGFQTDRASKLQVPVASRLLYESIVRTCVNEVTNIKIRTGAVVTGLDYDSQAKQVTGKPYSLHQMPPWRLIFQHNLWRLLCSRTMLGKDLTSWGSHTHGTERLRAGLGLPGDIQLHGDVPSCASPARRIHRW